MSSISELLTHDRIQIDTVVRSKKHCLEAAASLLSLDNSELIAREVFTTLCAREKQGSTGFGGGVAIPHGRISATEEAVGGLMRLKHGIDFDAIDGQQVDLVFCLAVPDNCEQHHLEMLAELAEFFSDSERRQALRDARNTEQILILFRDWRDIQKSA